MSSPRRLPTLPVPAFGPALGRARLRARPEDFRVREIPLVAPDGEGEHWLVAVWKRGLTTPEAGQRLAACFDVPPSAVSHAGLKDRNAVTEQWFSVHAPRVTSLPLRATDDFRIIGGDRHRRKLRPGTLRGNRFDLVLRDLDAPRRALGERLLRIAREGVPNYFGAQRFGRGGANVDKALAWFGGRLRVRRRDLRGLFLSAARAEVFNRVLARRVSDGNWNRPLAGDLMMLDGRSSLFLASAGELGTLVERSALGRIHPSGPLPGAGGMRPEADAARLEEAILAEEGDILAGLEQRGAKASRRPLRLMVRELWFHERDDNTLRLGFTLPPGGYATSVLDQCLNLAEGDQAIAGQ